MEDSLELSTFVQQFEEAEEVTRDSRKLAERDRDYFDEKQLTAAEKTVLEKRGQPAVVYNRVKRKVNSMAGLEKQTRKDPKAFPRNPDDDDAAQAATDVLRYVCDDSRWDDKRSQAARELAIEGTCAIMVGAKNSRNGIDPDIRRISWDRFYYDPHSSEFDFSDAAFMGVVIWMDLAKAIARFPDAKDALETTWARAKDTETYDDKPKDKMWADHKRKRVRICEHYQETPDGWIFCMFTQAGFVVEPEPSPYLGENRQPECPIKAVSLYVDRENNRYGEVRTMIGAQDEINKRRSKALHLISQRQIRVSPNVAASPREVRKELSRPDGVFVGERDDVEILPTNDMAQANMNLLQEAKAEIDLQGPNAALGGKNESDMSGRAIIAQQQGGMTELATYLDCIRVLSLAVYRSVWYRVQQFWDGERWIRVTDNEQNMRFVGVNQPVTALKAMAKQMGITKDNMQQAMQEQPEAVQQLQAFASDPRSQQVVQIENNVTELDVDISIDEGIDTPTIAAEEFQSMLKLAGTGMVQIPADVLIEASSLRNKDRLLEMLKEGPSPEQQQMQQVAIAGQVAEVEKTQSEARKNDATAQAALAKGELDAYQAGLAA
ncbi:hypothetical protein [Sphingorhabdus sp. SMR4y]|uniref:portal protein n=1 Tax=Sphingorhabdus sp. SMR4y TaxID=2584094 RepID=UPI000B5CA257|nr:hypothetical protein [Sphingorhabdus sp. SMR4y]ASK88469.1 hypothetical protein SPHFLASMR4Y_01722 [Sphingorhabdus sp. SMR4y]